MSHVRSKIVPLRYGGAQLSIKPAVVPLQSRHIKPGLSQASQIRAIYEIGVKWHLSQKLPIARYSVARNEHAHVASCLEKPRSQRF